MAEKLLDKNRGIGQVSPNRLTAATTSAKVCRLHRTWIRIQPVYLKLDERAIQPRANSATRAWREKVILQRRFIVAWHERIPSSLPLDPIEPLLDVCRAAHLLGISAKTLRDWIQARKIEYVKVGARVMIRPETIRQFVSSNTRRAAS
jgi:excisionase family DNA binding protein